MTVTVTGPGSRHGSPGHYRDVDSDRVDDHYRDIRVGNSSQTVRECAVAIDLPEDLRVIEERRRGGLSGPGFRVPARIMIAPASKSESSPTTSWPSPTPASLSAFAP